jgi:glutathione S-transferase
MMQKPRLISFKICPFAQRSTLLLKEKQVNFELAFINPDQPPEWFAKLSPTGKVPVLDIAGTAVFESAVIAEYLDETNPPSIHPTDPLLKATNRAWVEYTSGIYMSIFQLIMAKDETAFKQASATMDNQLAGLDEIVNNAPWFNGDDFSMVDIAAAPIAVRLDILKETTGFDALAEYNNLSRWFANLLQRKTVQDSYVSDLGDILSMRMKGNQSYLLTR